MNIETDRLIIKNGTIDDFKKVYEYNIKKLEDIAGEFVYEKQNPKEIESWFDNDIKKYYEEIDKKKNFDLILYLKDSQIPIGNLLLDRVNEKEKSIEVVCVIHPKYWGKGYMYEAMLSVFPKIYSMGFEKIMYSYSNGNKKSARLCEKVGFVFDSVNKNDYIKNGNSIDVYNYVLTKDDFFKLYK